MAESTIGLFKTEAVSKHRPFLNGPIKTVDDTEFADETRHVTSVLSKLPSQQKHA